ncbi:MAG: hypothetical protein HG465_001985 [Mogibacterium sp.]|uniref:hypothetical protein n=1 Tax=Mogibacterium sp. TaxID=2049035 RepID=UPI0017B9AE60|nr:hypothetical protein [Mogibacterium sp.]MBB1532880.1 hypothetical protein [Mogibacterium sp.]
MFGNFVNRLNEKKKVIIPSILVLVLIIGGAVYGVNHNKPIEKKPAKKAVHKVKEENKPEASSESVSGETTTKSSEASKPVENPKSSKAEKKAEKNSSAKSGSVATSSGNSSSTQASKPKEPIYATRTVQKPVQVYDPMKESYIQCACGCKNPSYEHSLAHARNGEPSGTKRVYVGGYVTKYETVTERYIIGYK